MSRKLKGSGTFLVKRFDAPITFSPSAALPALPCGALRSVSALPDRPGFSRTPGDCPRPELLAVDEFELNALAQTDEQRQSLFGEDRLHGELVFVDQSQVCQGQGECHSADPQAFA
jgi:hypothetical protein